MKEKEINKILDYVESKELDVADIVQLCIQLNEKLLSYVSDVEDEPDDDLDLDDEEEDDLKVEDIKKMDVPPTEKGLKLKKVKV